MKVSPQTAGIAATAGSMLLLDAAYLASTGPLWSRLAATISGQRPGAFRLWPIIMAYGAMVFTAAQFVVRPAVLAGTTLARVFWQGASLGMAMYAVFDGTNAVLFPQWPLALAVVDVVWGGLLFGAASATGTWAARAISVAAAVQP